MVQYIVRRMFFLLFVLLGVSVIVFSLIHMTPGDPVRLMLGEDATDAEVERLSRLYGFDRPAYVQYFVWLGRAVRGDLGTSIRMRASVTELVVDRMAATVELALFSLLLAVTIALPLGVLAAVKRGTLVDSGSMILSLIGVSMPNFWLGLVLLSYVALHVGWLPLFGRGPGVIGGIQMAIRTGDLNAIWNGVRHVLLPAVTLGTALIGVLTRLTRTSLLEVLEHDYVRTARAKGLVERRVVRRHALRNALLPVITIIGVQFGALLGGAITTEVVFAWPGIGRLIVNAISQRDFPLVQGGVLMFAGFFVFINLLVDLAYAVLDPRIRYD